MPIYEYRCGNCGHELEAIQKFSDPPLEACPECGRPALKRLISAPSFRLKGSGWYETDFKKDGQRNVLKSDTESKPASGDGKGADGKAGDSKASDSKPAAKASGGAAGKAAGGAAKGD